MLPTYRASGMAQEAGRDFIRIHGARHNNLKGFDLDLPTRSLIVVTGLSGSGKSSLAFDTLYAEGQRRYIETFSPYARQFFDRMDKPRVDAIEGIPPAIALDQRNSVRTTRSTVGTMTEICDHLKVLWPHLARLHCRQCQRPVTRESAGDIWRTLLAERETAGPTATASPLETLVTFRLLLSPKLSLAEQLALIARQGLQRLLLDDDVVRLEEAEPRLESAKPASLTVVYDRISLKPANRARFVEACEQAYHFGHGRLELRFPEGEPPQPPGPGLPKDASRTPRWTLSRPFSSRLHCATCDLDYTEPTPALFSFNHPLGACPACKGFGRIISIDYDLAIPDRSRTLAEGAVKPWQSGMSAECQADLNRAARREEVPLDVPFRDLSPAHQRWVIEGDPDYGGENTWPKAWYGVKGYFRWLESKAYKMHVRVLLSRYRAYTTCPQCAGRRLQPDALLWTLSLPELAIRDGRLAVAGTQPRAGETGAGTGGASPRLTLADFYALTIREALRMIDTLAAQRSTSVRDPFAVALGEVRHRLRFLDDAGVGYLTLDRPTRTLSGGETQRVHLTTCLGTRLVNSLFVLDEPSVGLHPRDTDRLVRILSRLRDLGNTVVVVEHEAAVMRAADRIVDLGPGHGEAGGHLVCHGHLPEILNHPTSLTGAYLAGRRRIEIPLRRPVARATKATRADLRAGFEETTGVSGTGRRASRIAAPEATVLSDHSVPYRSPVAVTPTAPSLVASLRLRHVTRHNLRDLEVRIPLGRLVCLTGVSGSGKTTLAGELLRLLRARLGQAAPAAGFDVREEEREPAPDNEPEAEAKAEAGGQPAAATLEGAEHLGAVLLVDQSPIGRTPRSNPAVYTGAFEPIRELFAQSEAARQRGLSASAFSFNSAQGQCETCRGAGFEKIEMQFLSDVFIRCPACEGRRYRPHILDVRIGGDTATEAGVPTHSPASPIARPRQPRNGLSVADILELTVDDAIEFLGRLDLPATRRESPVERAVNALRVVQEVGLGYLRLGQPINTLSGGESQRLKLAGHLATFAGTLGARATPRAIPGDPRRETSASEPSLFVFDEPTTGLHFEDIRVLLQAFQRLVEAGHSVLIIEHNLEVLKCADWLIDLGPEAGADGGRVVVAGTPEEVAACEASHTGRALRSVL